jgi:predicted transcriptional regulator YdeE
MQPKFRRHDSLFVVGPAVRTSNSAETDPAHAQIAGLWRRFDRDQVFQSVPHRAADAVPLGVYTDYESDQDGAYTLIAGVEVSDLSDVAQSFHGVSVDEADYLVFTGEGALPEAVISTWGHVWEFFGRPRCDELRRAFTTDFERYLDDRTVEIWIAVATGG